MTFKRSTHFRMYRGLGVWSPVNWGDYIKDRIDEAASLRAFSPRQWCPMSQDMVYRTIPSYGVYRAMALTRRRKPWK